MRLTWKKDAAETGLRAITAGPRGSTLHDGKTRYAVVSALGGGKYNKPTGWYWVAGWSSGVTNKNTCNEPCDTEADAKKAAREYVVAHLSSNAEVSGRTRSA
jgi:hypothetical protein